MSVSEPQARLAVRSVEDLIGLVPYLIGFHPEESLVAMVLQQGRVVVTARVDLSAVLVGPTLDDLLARLFGRFPGSEGWFLAYTDDESLAWEVLGRCVEEVGLARLGRLLHVGADRWRADHPDGSGGPLTGVVSQAAAQAAVLGLPARASRRELARGLAGPPDAEIDALVARTERASFDVERLGVRARRRALLRMLGFERLLTPTDCVLAAVLAARPEGQLAALRAVDRDTAERHLSVWTQVVRQSLTPLRPTVLGLLGVAAWQTGDGALQVVCLEELDRIDPATPLAGVLDWLNLHVVPPEDWRLVRPPLLAALEDALRSAGPAGGPRPSRPHT